MNTLQPIFLILVTAVVLTWTSVCAAELVVTEIGDSVVDPQALTIKGAFGQAINGKSFQQCPLVTHLGYQYIGFYDADRWVCIGRRELAKGDWDIVRFTDYHFESNDAHNTISMGICPKDGTIHIAFDHHGHPLHYRASKKGVASDPKGTEWAASLFGPVVSEVEKGKPIRITYPRFWQTPDGGLQFCYRQGGSGNGARMLVDYDPEQGSWTGTRQIDSGKGTWKSSDSRCSYPNGYDYGPFGKLHTTWVWREGPGTANHDLVYIYSEDRGVTWKNNAGETLDAPARVDTPGVTVVDIPEELGLMNTHGQAVDSKGRVHVVMWHCTPETIAAAGSTPGEHRWGPDGAQRRHHYWRDTDGAWQHRELPGPHGNRPKILVDKADNAYVVYCVEERFYVAAATAASNWTDWSVIYEGKRPTGNEMLPDTTRWQAEGVLSLMMQDPPAKPHDPTPLHVVDFAIEAR